MALPLRLYRCNEQPTYSVVPSNDAVDGTRRARPRMPRLLRQIRRADNRRRSLYFPQVLRDARKIGDYHPGLSPTSPDCMDKLGVSLAHCESECQNFYDAGEVERVFYPEIEKLLLDFFPGATDALVYNHDVFDKEYTGDRTEDQDAKNPGVNENYVNLVHNDLNDNSGRVRCRELLTKNLRNFGREQHYTEAEADAKMSRRFMSINLAKPMETVQQWPFVLCAWPSFADQPYINNYRDLRRPGRGDHPLHLSRRPRMVLASPADADGGVDAQMLRFRHRWVGITLVVPHRLRRPDRVAGRAVPQECGRSLLCVLLGHHAHPGRRQSIVSTQTTDKTIDEITAFWLGESLHDPEAASTRREWWYDGGTAVDDEIRVPLRRAHSPRM